MGLDFSKTSSQQPTVTTTPAPQEEMVVQSYDIVADRNAYIYPAFLPELKDGKR